MILIDTNAVVALVEPRDGLHAQAVDHLRRLRNQSLLLTSFVLAEVGHFLRQGAQRERVRALIEELPIQAYPLTDEATLWQEAFDWARKYADHAPDIADALLVVLCSRERRLRIWTYDEEFSTIWRRADGSRIPLAIRS